MPFAHSFSKTPCGLLLSHSLRQIALLCRLELRPRAHTEVPSYSFEPLFGALFPLTFLIAASTAQSLINNGFSVSSNAIENPSVMTFFGVIVSAFSAASSSSSPAPIKKSQSA
jgi:hypothetical protein